MSALGASFWINLLGDTLASREVRFLIIRRTEEVFFFVKTVQVDNAGSEAG